MIKTLDSNNTNSILLRGKHPDNKSLHPIWSVGPAFAICSYGAANAGPPAQTGELNRYVHLRIKHLSC